MHRLFNFDKKTLGIIQCIRNDIRKKKKRIKDEFKVKEKRGRKGIGASYRISVVYPRGSVTVRTLESRLHPPVQEREPPRALGTYNMCNLDSGELGSPRSLKAADSEGGGGGSSVCRSSPSILCDSSRRDPSRFRNSTCAHTTSFTWR